MSSDQLNIIRLQFQLAIHKKDGTEFQNFFQEIMERRQIGFISIAPQGRKGDGGNDGMIPKDGIYYQLYAPITPDDKVQYAIKKLETDFNKVLNFWEKKHQYGKLKTFIFVFNNKYKAIFTDIALEIERLNKKYENNIKFELFLAKHLEDEFLKLNDDDKTSCLNTFFLPPPNLTFNVNHLQDVIDFLVKTHKPIVDSDFPHNIDLVRKAQFNNLSKPLENYLIQGNYHEASLKSYFKLNANFVEEQLSKILKDYYNEAILEFEGVEKRSDSILLYIWEKATPKPAILYSQITMILISHYFEICDIFEEPPSSFTNGQLSLGI